ncbi:hypothetical protein GAY28_29230, partial [Azospirillum brasilense]|nr:hypothetical protein [Azospirillum brasilense]
MPATRRRTGTGDAQQVAGPAPPRGARAPARPERAREKMADLLALREGAPTGLIAYAGSAHLVLPPTPDASVVDSM